MYEAKKAQGQKKMENYRVGLRGKLLRQVVLESSVRRLIFKLRLRMRRSLCCKRVWGQVEVKVVWCVPGSGSSR